MRTASPLIVFAALVCSASCATAARQQRPGMGRVTIGVRTTGAAAPTLTFRVTIEPAGISGTVKADAGVFTNDDIPTGDHVIRLGDVPGRCHIEGGPERKISVTPQRRSVVLRFDVNCS